MPAEQRRKIQVKKAAPIKVALLLVQFLLIKLGFIPFFIIKALVDPLYFGIERASKLKIPNPGFSFPHFSLPHPGRGRGRPRKGPLLSFYLKRFTKSYKLVPKKIKVAFFSTLIILIIFLYTQFILSAAYQLPSPDKLSSYQTPTTTEIFDRNGKLLYRLYEGRNRSLVNLEDLPLFLIQATIAIEDKNFYKHLGIDFEAIIRAFYHNYQNKDQKEGASTITQQLIKNTMLTPEKTYSRKLKEIILSLWAEHLYSKNQILKMYFNEAPYGGLNWGIRAASLSYFNKEPKDLNLSEAAYLAGLPASPTQFSPYGTHPELGLAREKQVLERMVEEKYISSAQAEEAIKQRLNFRGQIEDIKAPHFVFYVRDLLAQKYGSRLISQGGLKITTTLDLGLQEEVERIVKTEVEGLVNLNVKNGAAMILDAKTGQILAMDGSLDYYQKDFGNFNVTLSLRQPGSSIKVITYATAFKKGYFPGNTVLDAPVVFRDEWGNSYAPQNYDGSFHGPVSIRQALGSSYNTPAVRVEASIGIDSIIQTARDLGITTFTDPKNYGLALTLGAADVKMIEMMGVYGTFSQMGVYRKPTPILKVTDSNGNILEEYQDQGRQALEPEIAYLVTDILADNKARTPAFGSSSLLNIPGQVVAVKTGTADWKTNNWTFGYTPDFVVGTWVGNPDNSPMNPSLTSGVTGATPIWNKIMKGLLTVKPSTGFLRPARVVEAQIDGRKDLAIAGSIPKGLVRVRTEAEKTIFSDAFSSYATPSAQAAIKDGVTN